MKIIKASVKAYKKLIDKGLKPLFPTMKLSSSVKYFVIYKKDKTFMNLKSKKLIML